MRLNEPRRIEQEHVVLLVDESADVHRLLSARLRTEDVEVVCAATAAEGLELAQRERPAVVLLDLDLPDGSGFELLRAMKDDAQTVHIPVIVLSPRRKRQEQVTAFDLGAVDFISKPFDLVELRVRVRAAVRTSVLLQMLAQRAQIDGLTELYNRAHFDVRWQEEVSGCVRHGRPLSLALIDCDRFKSINDTYGHPAGDAVLRGIGRVLRQESREGDIACRFGGEEFCLVMPDTPLAAATRVCERMRRAVEETNWPHHPERPVTISVGLVGAAVATHPDSSQWLAAADRNLYRAKAAGRNRVVAESLEVTLAKAG